MRHGRKHAFEAFNRLAQCMGKTVGTEHGQWSLSAETHQRGQGGGFLVVEHGEPVTHPLGARRYNASEFIDLCAFAVRALRVYSHSSDMEPYDPWLEPGATPPKEGKPDGSGQ